MHATIILRAIRGIVLLAAVLLVPSHALGQANAYRGLWVGSVSLHAVNEVSVPLDAANVPIAPNPEVPTPTFDRAQLRLLIHVNGAGQANLLRDVAILNRAAAGSAAGQTDMALVTDPRLYAEFPPQPAIRMASAAFDFGDAKATEALDAIVEEAARLAAAFVMNPSLQVTNEAQRVQARNSAVASITPALNTVAANANVSEAFSQFLEDFDSAAVDTIAADPGASIVTGFLAQAESLRDQSFYGDSRALDMVQAVVAAVQAAPVSNRQSIAHNTAASFADVNNLYQRFISGKIFGDMILAAADTAAVAAKAAGATEASILAELRATAASSAAMTEALQSKVQAYDDTRASDAIDAVLNAMASSAFQNAAAAAADIRRESEAAGRTALANAVARYPLPVLTPTVDYNAFVGSSSYQGAAALAVNAAVEAAIQARADDPLYTQLSVYNAAKLAALTALQAAYAAAARALRAELPLSGLFAPGAGDPRMVADLAAPSDLGAPGLQGRIYLPANHPTNPFRHRRHPDHTTGFDIQRVIRLDFDGAQGDSLAPAGYGVDCIEGTYREEIFGLHKPLGPNPDTAPIGLKTEGRFKLNRISLIDALNTR